ncbi:hypothetical protein E2P81_ATG09782 [Venturia nashicola]|uniref:Uncharacterized protein n=1 Tax=Venturia nashicola TaxID=86259 RepID=A0A4Z1NWB7_9PEZI|nr:hypothetical protein E6O75_ATG00003 [Venturia nashicola]TLD14565.1 hypothetical protein E2P81_ATG09782 [Venturia nashicola]
MHSTWSLQNLNSTYTEYPNNKDRLCFSILAPRKDIHKPGPRTATLGEVSLIAHHACKTRHLRLLVGEKVLMRGLASNEPALQHHAKRCGCTYAPQSTWIMREARESLLEYSYHADIVPAIAVYFNLTATMDWMGLMGWNGWNGWDGMSWDGMDGSWMEGSCDGVRPALLHLAGMTFWNLPSGSRHIAIWSMQ